MRGIAGLLVGTFFLGACGSSSVDGAGGACKIEGTYSATGVVESGDCAGSDQPVTDTFATLPDGRVQLTIQGLPDLAPIGTVDGCTWTASGAVVVTDAIDPTQKGTLQYSYTFTATGFNGIVSQSIPKAKSLPNGCTGTTKVTGTRR